MKFKIIPKEYFSTILDRLSRFEPAHIRYKRVVDDILAKFCLDTQVKNYSSEERLQIAVEIFNSSINPNTDFYINDILIDLEKKYFKFNEVSYQYLSARFNLSSMLDEIDSNKIISKNLLWLKNTNDTKSNLIEQRKQYSLLFPIEKIILCEGQTEFTLLNTLFKLLNYDLDKNGVMILPAGGKNQVARKYYELIEYVNVPFFILLDKDAQQIEGIIKPKLRDIDNIYLIQSGEFEDLIPANILLRAINTEHSSEINCNYDDFNPNSTMVENLKLIYRKYGFGEFKKAHFASILNDFIKNNCSKNDFLESEIVDILNICLKNQSK